MVEKLAIFLQACFNRKFGLMACLLHLLFVNKLSPDPSFEPPNRCGDLSTSRKGRLLAGVAIANYR
jgi:hypothetical protein